MVDQVLTAEKTNELKQGIYDYCRTRLGDGMIEVELDPKHYETGLITAIDKFKQRAESSVEESYGFLELQEDTNVYTLPDEVVNVRQIFRRTVGGANATEGGTFFDPFELAYTNVYLLQSGRIGGLATYEMFAGYQELVGRMFGGYINYYYDTVTRKLEIVRRQRNQETVLLWLYNHKPDGILLQDRYAKPWLRDYTLAICKMTLGEARGKFATIAGPQGGTSLNGDQLKADGQQEIEKLEASISNYEVGQTPMSFVIG
ncbi:hypothetical protein CMI38_04650 [Candidatus Pacearchaeota archaeon]|jgi:hypothetical protein|nr:hypothetical protein [Candidatus Pacearchaeota archaeon]